VRTTTKVITDEVGDRFYCRTYHISKPFTLVVRVFGFLIGITTPEMINDAFTAMLKRRAAGLD